MNRDVNTSANLRIPHKQEVCYKQNTQGTFGYVVESSEGSKGLRPADRSRSISRAEWCITNDNTSGQQASEEWSTICIIVTFDVTQNVTRVLHVAVGALKANTLHLTRFEVSKAQLRTHVFWYKQLSLGQSLTTFQRKVLPSSSVGKVCKEIFC